METSTIDTALWALGAVGNFLLLLLLIRQRLYRRFPVFTGYFLFTCITDCVFFVLLQEHLSSSAYFVGYFVNLVPDFLLQLGILVEVGWNVLSPLKRSLPRSSLIAFAAMVICGTIFALVISHFSKSSTLSVWSKHFLQINFTFGILRMVLFLAIAGFSQMLGINWKHHVLQIATGFAGYSMIILIIEMLHRFLGAADPSQYHILEQFRTVGWCLTLGYWGYFLAKKEPNRKEFSSKMEGFLIAISGVAKNDREIASRLYRK